MTSPITATPNPVSPGQGLTICYDFPENQSGPVKLTLDWSPSGLSPSSVTVSPDEPCATISVPQSSDTIIVEGPGGATLVVSIS